MAGGSGGIRNILTTNPLERPIAEMKGRNTREKATNGPVTTSATSSERWSASALGACSPSTTCR